VSDGSHAVTVDALDVGRLAKRLTDLSQGGSFSTSPPARGMGGAILPEYLGGIQDRLRFLEGTIADINAVSGSVVDVIEDVQWDKAVLRVIVAFDEGGERDETAE
jgi:hypothetical protein